MTKAVIAVTTTLATLALGGYLMPTLLFVGLVLPGALAGRIGWRVVRAAALVTLPIAIAVGLVSVFTRTGATLLFVIGPFDATLEGVDFAARVVVRLFVTAAAVTLFGLTTAPRAFVADLERRGVPARLAYAFGGVLDVLPAVVERAQAVRDAQRARGLDIDAGVVPRARGVVPLVGPVVVGVLHRVEARSLALDARGFGRTGPRHLLWAPGDTPGQRSARWLLLAALAAVIAGAVTGAVPRLP